MKFEIESTRSRPEEIEADSVEDAISQYVALVADIEDEGVTDGEFWVTQLGHDTVKYVAQVTITVEVSGIEQKDWT